MAGMTSDCISRFANIPAEGDRTPHRHAGQDGPALSILWFLTDEYRPKGTASSLRHMVFEFRGSFVAYNRTKEPRNES